jgi:hypothetical protein
MRLRGIKVCRKHVQTYFEVLSPISSCNPASAPANAASSAALTGVMRRCSIDAIASKSELCIEGSSVCRIARMYWISHQYLMASFPTHGEGACYAVVAL